MADDPLRGLVEEALPAPTPSPGFADRVALAWQAERARRPARRGRRIALGAAVVAAGAVVALRAPRSGAVEAGTRTEVDVGRRGAAVAEAGGALRWRVGWSGAAEVEQTGGNVFYRVEPAGLLDGAFRVSTPAGDVVVTGTCFRVEVEPMSIGKQGIVGAGVGAAITATVLVSVYEGRVTVKNAHGQTELAAGERGRIQTGTAPEGAPAAVVAGKDVTQPPPDDVSRDELLLRDRAQREHIAMLQARLRREGPVVAKRGGAEGAAPGEPSLERGDKFFDFTPEELKRMAAECEIRFDLPPYGTQQPPQLGERHLKKLSVSLSPEESAAINEVLKAGNERFVKTVRGLYREVTGDDKGAETLDLMAMKQEIEQKSGADSMAARKKLAQERAGLLPPGSLETGTPVERLLRLSIGEGDRLQKEIAARIGFEKAAAFRKEASGMRSIMNGCDDED